MSCLIKCLSFSDYNQNNRVLYISNNEQNRNNINNQINNTNYRTHLFNKKNELNQEKNIKYPGSLKEIYNLDKDIENECSICLETNTDTVLKCGHIYHYKCMLEWLKICLHNKTDLICPYCRAIECKKINN